MTAQGCSVDGCERPAKGKRSWCGMHTERWRRWGDPTEVHPRLKGSCAVEDCRRPHEARGYCALHYRRWSDTGNPLTRRGHVRAKMPELDRLLRHLDRTGGPDSCWPWMAHCNASGYGVTYVEREGRRRTRSAHRAVYAAVNGEIPKGLLVRHLCDNPPCCNPAHLRAGTHLENMADRQQRGAGYPTGNDAPRAVQLDEATLQAIREAYAPGIKGGGQHALARRFGLSRTTIQRIVTHSDRWAESA